MGKHRSGRVRRPLLWGPAAVLVAVAVGAGAIAVAERGSGTQAEWGELGAAGRVRPATGR